MWRRKSHYSCQASPIVSVIVTSLKSQFIIITNTSLLSLPHASFMPLSLFPVCISFSYTSLSLKMTLSQFYHSTIEVYGEVAEMTLTILLSTLMGLVSTVVVIGLAFYACFPDKKSRAKLGMWPFTESNDKKLKHLD